jgi:hypothetical protein
VTIYDPAGGRELHLLECSLDVKRMHFFESEDGRTRLAVTHPDYENRAGCLQIWDLGPAASVVGRGVRAAHKMG